jgi:hypothetical protein
MTPILSTAKTPEFLCHEDTRVAAILSAAQSAADDVHARPVLTQLVVEIVHGVDREMATKSFQAITEMFEEAIDFDTRGAEAVWEQYGRDPLDYMSGDERATELRDERRESGRVDAEMLVSLHDSLRKQLAA